MIKKLIFIIFLLCIIVLNIYYEKKLGAAQVPLITIFFDQQIEVEAIISKNYDSYVSLYNEQQHLSLLEVSKATVKEIKKIVASDFYIFIELNVYETRNLCAISLYDLTVSQLMHSFAFTYISLTNLNKKLKLFFDAFLPTIKEYKSNSTSIFSIQAAVIEKDKNRMQFCQIDNLENTLAWNIDEMFAFSLKQHDFLNKYKYFNQEEAVINARMLIAANIASELVKQKANLQKYEINKATYSMVTMKDIMKEAAVIYLRVRKNQSTLAADIVSFLLNL